MTNLLPASIALVLALCLSGCDERRYLGLLTGTYEDTDAYADGSEVVGIIATADVESPSSDEVVSSEPVIEPVIVAETEPEYVPPPPPPCEPVAWRGNWYSCDMLVLIGPVE